MKIKSTVVFQKNRNSNKKITINRGGTRSWKTYSMLQLLLVWLLTGKIDDNKVFESWVATVVRKQKSVLRWTVIRDREEIIVNSGCDFLLSQEHRNKTDRTYSYQWRMVEFIGADDQQKLRGGKRDILYCNEANELSYDMEFFQLLIRTSYKVFIDFNPDNEYVWINTELEQKRRFEEWDVEVIVSTYKDNPFLPEVQVKEIERLEKTHPRYWEVYWLGKYGKLEGIIFTGIQDIEIVPESANFIGYWLDFWHTNDPSALIAGYEYNGNLILDEEFYDYWLTNPDIFAKIRSRWLEIKDRYIADSAEPKSIEELYRMWLNVKWVKKWKDSIKFGIQILQQYPIIYITARSSNLRREVRWYVWDKDKNGKWLNQPAVSPDHAIDAARYLVMSLVKPRRDIKHWILQAKR